MAKASRIGSELRRLVSEPLGVALALVAAAAPLCAAPGDPIGAEFQVNSYTTNSQYKRFSQGVSALAGGGFVVVWDGNGQDGSSRGVFGQRYDSAGAALGAEFQVNSYTTSVQAVPAVAGEAGGGFVVLWHDNTQDGSGYGVFGQRYDSAGAALGAEFQVNSYTMNAQRFPAVAGEAGGGFVVVWNSYTQDVSNYGVFGRRYDSAGAALGTEFQVNSYTMSGQLNPAVAGQAGGGLVVVWESSGQEGSGRGVFGQRYDSAGAALGTEFQVNSYTMNAQRFPAVAGEAGGGFVVVWDSYTQDGSGYGVFGQRYDSAGAALGSEFQVNSYTTSFQRFPAVAGEAGGGFVVVWNSYTQDAGNYGVFGRRYDSAGAALGTEFQVNSYTTLQQRSPAVAGEAGGGFVVVWDSNGQDASGYGVFGQRYEGELVLPPTSTPTPTPTETETATQTATPTPSVAACAATPVAGCATPGKALVKIKDTGDAAKRQVLWKWLGGTATNADFGDPTMSTSYALCAYRDGTLLLSAVAEADGNWTPTGSGFKYRNTATNADGVFKALLKEGTGKAKVLVKGKGANLTVPALPLSPATGVTVQLVKNPGSGAQCWQADFAAPATRDTATQFKDKTP
jgi:hypothetical protein